MRIAFMGDFMLSGDQCGQTIKVSSKEKQKLMTCDFRVATLETAVGEYKDIDDSKSKKSEVAVWSKQNDIHKLSDLGINVVSLANNHACDCGIDALLRLKEVLIGQGIMPIGAGRDFQEAMRPAILEKDGESLAIIGCCEDNPIALGNLRFATETTGGINKLDEEIIISQIRALKKTHTYVAVVVHWGVEHKWLPELNDVTCGKKMIDAGADFIIGGHPHHVQPKITYKECPIFFSLGNFYFPDFCLDRVSNVFYPSEEECNRLPVFCWMDPIRRSFAMKYFWKYYGRLGMVAFVEMKKGNIEGRSLFSIYKKGRLSCSSIQLIHRFTLKMFSFFVGSKCSIRINNKLMKFNTIIETKLLAVFIKKYGFYRYLRHYNLNNK